MAFASQIFPKEVVIDDANYLQHAPPQDVVIDGETKTRGLIPRDFSAVPHGSLGFAAPFGLPLIPESEWPERIEQMERTKTRLSDICDQAGLPCKDQNGTNYCWINSPTYCTEVVRVAQNEPMVILSPASAGGPIKGFRNVGGWGAEGLEYIVEHGLVPVDKWPANAIDRRYNTAENRELAMKYRVTEWWDLKPRNFQQLATCLLSRIPVAGGFNFWSHEVTLIDLVRLPNGKYGVRFRNSWGMSYGDRGYSILTGNQMLPDDAVAPRVALPG